VKEPQTVPLFVGDRPDHPLDVYNAVITISAGFGF
jgi:hypothetical protein